MYEDQDQIARQRIEKLVRLDDKEVLEVGCGKGRVTAMLADRVRHIVALDPDQNLIREARTSFPDIDFRTGSGQALDFPDQSFDLVLFTLSLHHQDSRSALEEGARVLRPGGRVLVLEPAVDGEVQRLSTVFEDEAPALIFSHEAIKNCSLSLEETEVFHTEWIFADREELYAYHFEYFQQDYDQDLVRQMDAFLGRKVESSPIILQDKLVLCCLRKD